MPSIAAPASTSAHPSRRRSGTSGPAASSGDRAPPRHLRAGDRRDVCRAPPVVVAADGVSSCLATAVGRQREDRVMGVAVRATQDAEAGRLPESHPSCGPVTTRATGCSCPATAGSSRSRTVAPTWGSASWTPERLRAHRLQGRHGALGRGHRLLGTSCTIESAGPIRGATLPDGLQPHPAMPMASSSGTPVAWSTVQRGGSTMP